MNGLPLRRRGAIPTRLGALLIAAIPLFAAGCGGGEPSTGGVTTTLHPSAPPLPGESECTVTEVTEIPVASASHLPTCMPITYATNPPSGGDHWAVWAAFKKYDQRLPNEMLVHDLEHGAIALLYRCDGECPDVVDALGKVFDGMADPLCLTVPGGPPARMILAPDPDLPTPIAAAAWGATYTATCIDVPSLQAFANEHYAKGPENLCNNGVDPIAMPPCGG
jgi:hypothetical protein